MGGKLEEIKEETVCDVRIWKSQNVEDNKTNIDGNVEEIDIDYTDSVEGNIKDLSSHQRRWRARSPYTLPSNVNNKIQCNYVKNTLIL